MSFYARCLLCPILILLSCIVRAGDDWFPYSIPWNDNPANFTNLSAWNEKPAGKHGFVTVRDGHLAAGDQRLRMIGVNIVFGSAEPTHEDADGIAARLARFGVNVVRLHHMDSSPAPRGLLQKDMRSFDAAQLERLDYFIAALKREGIYCDLNLHVGRVYPGFANWGEETPKYWKGVDNFYAPMIAMQKDYARTLLDHVNPYTGKRYAEEPAIAFIEINNENGLLREWRSGSFNAMIDPYQSDLQRQWTQWLRRHYDSSDALAKAWGARSVPYGEEMFAPALNVTGSARGWNLQLVGNAQASATRLPDGSNALNVTRVDADRWHVQWHQNGLRFKAGEPYTVSLRMRADRPVTIALQAMQAHAPWQHLWATDIKLDTQWRDFRFTFAPTQSDELARFTIGNLGGSDGMVWLADASLRPGGQLGLREGESLDKGNVAWPTTTDFLSRTLQAQRDWLQFLWETESAYWTGMRDFIKHDLGAQSLVIGTQVSYSPAPIQAQLDVVDGHAYWQHPQFPGKPWDLNNWRIGNSAMAGIDGAGTLADLALRRPAGKPFIVTEYNHPMPNEYAAETFPLLAAYAALQDWDAIFAYSYGAHDGNWNPGYRINFFDINADPVKMSSLVAAAALFRRGDVATPGASREADPSHLALIDNLRSNYRMPGADLLGTTRNLAVQRPVSLGTADSAPLALPVTSVTGQLVWGVAGRQTVSINTPRSKGLIGAALGDEFNTDGIVLRVLQADKNSGVLMANVMEGDGFTRHARILVTALGNSANTDQQWQDAAHTTLGRFFGAAPVRVEGIRARISLPFAASRLRAWALDEHGNRREALTVSAVPGEAASAVIETGPQYRALWYEIEIL